MFYSHEILTSRKYGVATIWIVATLGSKTTLGKKVTKQSIMNVDVPKAVETIINPEVPMALRLQSGLLFGVSRVYDQQCGYVLSDAQKTQENIKHMMRVVKNTVLDPEAGRAARPEQLLLPDDPNFLPDFALTNLNLDMDLDLTDPGLTSDTGSSQLSSILSPHTLRAQSPSIIIPTSAGDDFGPLGGLGGFMSGDDDESRARMSSIAPGSIQRPPGHLDFDPHADLDLDLGLDQYGNADATGVADTPAQRAESVTISEQVRRDHEARDERMPDVEDVAMLPPMDDDDGRLPDARAFTPRATPAGDEEAQAALSSRHRIEEDEEYAEAPARRVRQVKPLQADAAIEISTTELRRWERDYLNNMAEISAAKVAGRAATQAKKNVDFWIWQMGIAGVGGHRMAVAPGLKMFQGDRFIIALLGEQGRKRDGSPLHGDGTDGQGRRVRSRTESPRDEEVGRGNVDAMQDDEGLAPIGDDPDIEVGREAATPMAGDIPADISSAMPWNMSASQRLSSALRGTMLPPHRGSRAGSVSSAIPQTPLYGRGGAPTLPERLSRQGSLVPGSLGLGAGGGGYTSSVGGGDIGFGLGGADNDIEMGEAGGNDGDAGYARPMDTQEQEEFEMFGPAAQVDTQQAVISQWLRTALDTESANFLEFVEVEVARQAEEHDGAEQDGVEEARPGQVTFEALLPPAVNTSIVAAQGLLHCLALVTKGLLKVEQAEEFGDIWLQPVARARGEDNDYLGREPLT